MRTTASPSTWIHLAKLVNFFGYDSSERRRMTIGPGVLMPPTVSVRNGANISIGRGAKAGGGAAITSDVSAGAYVNGYPAIPYLLERRIAVLRERLPQLFHRVDALEAQVKELVGG